MGSIMCFIGYEDVDSCYAGLRTDDVFLSFTFQRDAQDFVSRNKCVKNEPFQLTETLVANDYTFRMKLS